MKKSFLVCIQCMTYNHAPYIEDAMNGFCMEPSDFPKTEGKILTLGRNHVMMRSIIHQRIFENEKD